MKRTLPYLLVLLCGLVRAGAAPLPGEQREASVAYVNSLQNSDGGFRASAAAAPSQLTATSSSLRALKYLGGRLRDKDGPVRFVNSCYDPAAGGFADTPGGKVDVRSTAMGLMAMVELKQPLEERLGRTADYFAANAKTLPDTYIAAAALDAAGRKPADPAPWIAGWEAVRNPDGSYGKGAPDTASAVILTLRVGGTVKEPATAARALKAAQRPDGGFSLTGGESDLPTVYRMMRALIMLKEKPDVDRLSAFIARCRNADGGYGPTPGQPSTASATYNAAIVMKWIDELAKG